MGGAALELRDRRLERARLDRLIADVRSGQGQVLVARGEAGIGKSALLDYLVGRADGCRIVRASGVEAEMELPFTGLHQLCGRMLDLADRLPGPQRDALAVAFGLEAGGPPDRFLVGAATLGLLSEASANQPLLCVVDDAQWLDHASAQTLTFVGRRLLADRIGMAFAVREPVDGPHWRGFPELVIGGLADHDAESLLAAVVPGRLDERIRHRIVAETRGNPLALLELPRGLTAGELAGGFERPDARPLPSLIEHTFTRRVRSLPPQTQRLLLTAAAEPVGDLPLLLRALTIQDVPVDAAAPAEADGLIELGARVRFRHPLVRSAIYRAASAAERRVVHQALADATDVDLDRDRRAWHRAHGASGPDEDVAGELARSADRAQRRGGVAAAAAFLQRATELTPDPATRATRALAAARTTMRAGGFEAAQRWLLTASDGAADPLHHAHVDLTRAQLAFAAGHSRDAPRRLLEVARRLEPLDADLARDTYLDALAAAIFAGRLAGESGVVDVARAAKAAPPPTAPRKRDLLLDGAAALFADGYPAAALPVGKAIRSFRDDDGAGQDDLRWLWLASALAVCLWDDESWDVLTARHVALAREAGDLTELPLVLSHRVLLDLFSGNISAAGSLVAEIRTICDATGVGLAPYSAIGLAVWRGRVDEATGLIDTSRVDAEARGEGGAVTYGYGAHAVLMNGLARYPEALASARSATAHPAELGAANLALTELFEAAVRGGGRPEEAAGALARLTEMAQAAGTDWALGLLARSNALLAAGPAAEAHYREALERLAGTRIRMDLARTHLLYGEWLRREGRRQDARTQLRSAHGMFTAAGAAAFAERARRELAATGEVVDEHARPASEALTAQEAHVADLAGAGLTNAEIGARLFLSHHTVEWHLRKVFTKLGITSRRQLRPPA
ncbi:LuxR family transcriptional regulator [Jiangella anatolica]|uniref:LuxR family transcriptional regulator n=2 Tax=Jiangella anatolica TaxID=2670374 RepID=A0A2W2CR05_9ACTN|nr:LuxR family transcriptional regulator [Jiangella anatolica]